MCAQTRLGVSESNKDIIQLAGIWSKWQIRYCFILSVSKLNCEYVIHIPWQQFLHCDKDLS